MPEGESKALNLMLGGLAVAALGVLLLAFVLLIWALLRVV